MIIVNSINNIPIRVSDERVSHIFENHPEMKSQLERIIKTLEKPELITKGDSGEVLAIKHYNKSPVTNNKYLIAVYKELSMDGFLITAYYTRKYNLNREVLWKR
jgi:NADPH-dependent curcumin reductase CurA